MIDAMTDELSYNPAGYRNMVKMSKFKYILVEGKFDKIALLYLIDELFGKRSDLRVHGAYQIQFGSKSSSKGNREKVEEIAESIGGKKFAKRFVGFVDREFRGFNFENGIEDTIAKHNVIDRLIWTRGHSIENYYFDFSLLRGPLRDFTTTSHFSNALDLFEQNLEQIIKLACAASLAGLELGQLEKVKSSIDWSLLQFDTSKLIIITSNWSSNLTRGKMSNEAAQSLIGSFQIWLEKLSEIDFSILRWFCHGHIGIAFIWAAYARCVLEVGQRSGSKDPLNEARNVVKAEETVRCNGCASAWAERAQRKSCEYPEEIFAYLDLSV
jgi:hypothetical protein